jgi:hypothetical protein
LALDALAMTVIESEALIMLIPANSDALDTVVATDDLTQNQIL